MTEEEFCKTFLVKYQEEFAEHGLNLSISQELQAFRFYPDFIIKDESNNIVAILEIKKNFNDRSIEMVQNRMIDCFLHKSSIRLGIIIDLNENCIAVIPRGINSAALIPQTFGNVKKYLFELFKKKDNVDENVLKEKILHDLKTKFNKITESKFVSFLNSLNIGDIELSTRGNHLTKEKEMEFFSNLLWSGNRWQHTLTKYGSKGMLFRMINDKKQSMASIVNMNDKSECDFADKLLNRNKAEWYDSPDSIVTTNSFIMSMVAGNRNDELTPWRLYGDDAKGVSITYDMGEEGNMAKGKFFVAPICYVNPKKRNSKLTAISNVMRGSKTKVSDFIFVYWYIWKHFFKHEDYKVEEEYRILYQRDFDENNATPLKWVSDPITNIIFPVIEFYLQQKDLDANDNKARKRYSVFPFPIKEIKLGSNMSEQQTNKTELRLMMMDKLGLQYDVKESSILNYRS